MVLPRLSLARRSITTLMGITASAGMIATRSFKAAIVTRD